MGKLILLLIVAIFLMPFIKAQPLASIGQDIDRGYRVLAVSGNESCYSDVVLSDTHQRRIDINVRASANRQCTICDGDRCSNQRIDPPVAINIYDRNGSVIAQLPLLIDHYTFIIPDLVRGRLRFLKFGEESIIITGDTTYNSTDINVTQETGFAHLAIDPRTNYYSYVPSAVARVVGTDSGGNITYTQADDGLTYNTTEVAASPGLDVRLNFTSTLNFDTVRIKARTASLLGQTFDIQLFNYTSASWVGIGNMTESSSLRYYSYRINPTTEFAQNNISQLRILDANLGSLLQEMDVDYAELSLANPYRSLKAYHSFDMDNATVAFDLSNYSSDGIYTDVLNECVGAIFGCAIIDNSTSSSLSKRIDLGNAPSLFFGTGNFTIMAWLNHNSSQLGGIIKRGTASSNLAAQQQYMLFVNINGSIQFTVGNQTTSNSISTFANVSLLGQWVHVAAQVNESGAMNIFINGILNATGQKTTSGGIAVNNGTMFSARGTGIGGSSLDGMLDEIMLANESWMPWQILGVFKNASNRFQPQGEMLFRNINLQNNDTINITVNTSTLFGSNVSFRMNNGANVLLVNGVYSGYLVSGNLSNVNLTMVFTAGNSSTNLFYTSYISKNITIDSVRTQFAPTFHNLTEMPSDPQRYNALRLYQFNVTWQNQSNISVTLTFNGTNFSILPSNIGVYNFSIIGLGVATHTYRWSAIDGLGNTNATSLLDYTIIDNPSDVFEIFPFVNNSVPHGWQGADLTFDDVPHGIAGQRLVFA